jgi:hypothetical protein
MMYWRSLARFVLLVVSFTDREAYAVLTHEPTLSHAAAEAGAKWPPLFVLLWCSIGRPVDSFLMALTEQ